MAKLDRIPKESISKGNSEDSLLVIYILHILKKYSSPEKPLSSQEVMDYLRKDYSIGNLDKADAGRKKVRRHLDTLCEFYPSRCIKKEEGKTTREGHKWFYDVSRDKFANKEVVMGETLTETEVELLVDLISATKILNSAGTRGLVDKLLKKTSLSYEERKRRLRDIQKEGWMKTPNEDLAEKKGLIEECFDTSNIIFDYEEEECITATPLGWSYEGGICFLNAKVGEKIRQFSLDKIRNYDSVEEGYQDVQDFCDYDHETDSDKTALDSLFVNIPTIKSAIAHKKCLHFWYRSYRISEGGVACDDQEKSILPHSLVFHDGKYYLIGIDENTTGRNQVGYFRVDLMFELCGTQPGIKLSNWDKYIFETIERARVVEKHPFMLVGSEIFVTFKVAGSGLDRVVDAFAVKPDTFVVTDETRPVEDSSEEGFREERVVEVRVRTTAEEAFRFALANADVVELVFPQELRDRLGRIANPIYRLYTQTLPDKVRENIDYVLKEGTFQISHKVDENTAYSTYKELAKMGKLDVVNNVGIWGEGNLDNVAYFGEFSNAKRLKVSAWQIKDLAWASKLIQVKELDLVGSQVEDVSWMKEMKQLKWVYLTETPISDLSVLSEHEDIDTLDISGTNIRDIRFIEKFSQLKRLHIAKCPIEDYSPLFTTRSHLKYLEIDKNALEEIGEETIRNRHIGIEIEVTNNSPFWYL